jgi:hypothetical protein
MQIRIKTISNAASNRQGSVLTEATDIWYARHLDEVFEVLSQKREVDIGILFYCVSVPIDKDYSAKLSLDSRDAELLD